MNKLDYLLKAPALTTTYIFLKTWISSARVRQTNRLHVERGSWFHHFKIYLNPILLQTRIWGIFDFVFRWLFRHKTLKLITMTCHNIKGEVRGFILKMDNNAKIQAAGENESRKKILQVVTLLVLILSAWYDTRKIWDFKQCDDIVLLYVIKRPNQRFVFNKSTKCQKDSKYKHWTNT